MARPRVDWAALAERAGIVTRPTSSGGSMTNQGSEEARQALEWLIGEHNIRRGVELWLAGRAGEQAAAAAAWSVLTYICSCTATEIAYEAYRAARKEGDTAIAGLAVVLISDICHPAALEWVDEFLAYGPTTNPGLGLVDQALFRGVLDLDDERLERWLGGAAPTSDPYLQEAVHRIRASMARWSAVRSLDLTDDST